MKKYINYGLTLYAIILIFCVLNNTACCSTNPMLNQIVIGNLSEPERLACIDLQRYISQVTKNPTDILTAADWSKNPVPALIIGTPRNNRLIVDRIPDADKISNQGYYLTYTKIENTPAFIIAAYTSKGVVNAIYGFLRELGFGFYLGAEAIPDSLPDITKIRNLSKTPAFSIRGVLPWYNFFNSPTTWDSIDHRAFIDQLIRMGANFVGFHTYDGEPFAGYKEDGKYVWGERLLNTASPTWGTHPLPADKFGFDTGKLYPEDYFGAATTISIKNREEAIEAEQNIMRDALDYAKKRGLHPCIGFELWGDPLNPKDRDVFINRLNHILNQYPSVDYIWIWQAETQGAQGYGENYNMHILPYTLNKDSHLSMYGAALRDTFSRIVKESKGQPPFFQNTGTGESNRANEGARLTLFSNLALNIMNQRTNPPKLAVSGWGGETRIMSAEYYDGLDKLLPDSVVFASLDFINPLPKVDSIYRQLPSERQRWPIIWLENDGDQWQPQPYVHILENTMNDVRSGGSQGILGIHWRTREIQENFAYIIQNAWNPKLTAEDYFKDMAYRYYDEKIADEMASIHSELDLLGYRWVEGGGQAECAPFSWGPGSIEKVNQLYNIRKRITALLPDAGKGKSKLDWLLNNIDWVITYHRAESAAVKAKELIIKAENSNKADALLLADEALSVLENGDLGTAMHTYAQRITTRGEYGVLATINTKAFVDWESLKSRALSIKGSQNNNDNDSWIPAPKIILPRLITSVEEGKDLLLQPVILGGNKAWMHYRSQNDQEWKTEPIEFHKGWVGAITIKGDHIRQNAIEVGFSFSENPADEMVYQPITITVQPNIRVNKSPIPTAKTSQVNRINARYTNNPAVPIQLVWNPINSAEFYRVYRDDVLAVETPAPFFPDAPVNKTGVYKIEAVRNNKVIASSSNIPYKTKSMAADENFSIDTIVNAAGVALQWQPAKNPAVTSYSIYRKPANNTDSETLLGEITASRGTKNTFRDLPPTGEWLYIITPKALNGDAGKPITKRIVFKANYNIKPALNLPLTSKPEDANVVNSVSFTADGGVFKGGYITIPHNSYMNMGKSISISFEFKADSTQGMPVILSHGLWLTDGWFAQILGGTLIIKTPAADIAGPPIYPGTWYKALFIYDGDTIALKVNDIWYQSGMNDVKDIPAKRNLIIGQYEALTPDFAFYGEIKNIKIYNDVISE